MKLGNTAISGKAISLLALLCFNSNAEDFFALSIEELLNYEISVATKSSVALKHAPASVSVFSQEDIQSLGVRSLQELFNHIPGFHSSFTYQENNQSYLITRGHAQKYASTVLFLWNGMRINEDYTGGINYLLRHVSLHDVDSVEVIRGPGAALYGSNALNGVVNIKTKTLSNSLTLKYGSQELKGLLASGHINKAGWNASASFQYEENQGDDYSSIFDRFGLAETTSDPNQVTDVKILLSKDKFSWNSWFHNTTQDDFYLFRRVNNGINQLKLKQQTHQVAYQFIENNEQNLKVEMQWQDASRQSIGALQPQTRSNDAFLFGVSFDYKKWQMNTSGSLQLNDNNELFTGISLEKSWIPTAALKSNFDLFGTEDQLEQVVTFSDANQRTVLDITRKSQSAYMSLVSKVSTNLTLTTGLRYDDYNDVNGRLNPRLALVYHPSNSGHVFKALYGEAYKAASMGDLYDEESGLTIGNQQLDHTLLKSWELVHEYTSAELHTSLVYFKNDIKDLIGFTAGELVRLDNIGHNQAEGIEFSFKYHFFSDHQLSGNITHLLHNHSQAIKDNDLIPSELLAPNNYGSFSYAYQLAQQAKLAISATYRDEIDVLRNGSNRVKLNANLSWQQWRISIHNLTNDKEGVATQIPIGVDGEDVIQYLPDRGLEFSIAYQFKW